MSALAYRREIDGLRAIAVAAVVAYHAGLAVPAGFVGVDIFFVISGYLITSLLLREQDETGRISLRGFYARRVRRIFPAAIVVVLGVVAASLLLLSARALNEALDSAVAAALFASNLYFQAHTSGYFDATSEQMPLLHLWSLAVEEQFYLAWPLLVMLVPRPRLRAVMVGLGLASFALAEWLSPHAAFYQMPARFWELAAGGLVATAPMRALPRWLSWAGIVLLAGAVLVPMPRFPGTGALPAVVGSVAVIAALHGGARNRLLASPPFVELGLISYSLYLWHWPLLAFYGAAGGEDFGMRISLCALALLLAFGSYRYVETPFRRKLAPQHVGLAGFCVFAIVAGGAFAISRAEYQTPAARAARDWPANLESCGRGAENHAIPGPECASGPSPRIALWGDSMAMAWQPLAIELARREGTEAMLYSHNDCKPGLGYKGAAGPACVDWNAAVLPRVQAMDTVILAGRYADEAAPGEQHAGLEATLDALRGVHRVILIGPTPRLRSGAPNCLGGNDVARCAITRAEFLHASAGDRAFLAGLAGRHANAEFVDPTDWFCDAAHCRAVAHGMPLYWDNVHVSTRAANAFARYWLAASAAPPAPARPAKPAPATARVPASWADIQALPVPPPGQRIAYGPGPKQFGNLRRLTGRGPHPVVILLHGGCWQGDYTVDYMEPLAAQLARDGIATWNVEYRGIGDAGGGWPGTFQDVAAASAMLQAQAHSQALDLSRVVAVGHSAGGQLALWLAANHRPPLPGATTSAAAPALRGVVALAGIVDLRDYAATPGGCNQSVVPLLGGTPERVPQRYAATSPSELLPIGVPMRLFLGSVDPIVTRAHEERFVASARARGDDVTLQVVDGEGHFDLVLPGAPSSTRLESAIRRLLDGGAP